MIILLTENPGNNSYIQSLMNEYKNLGHSVVCNVNNFFSSNLIPDILHIHWPERLYKWHNIYENNDANQFDCIKDRLDFYKKNGVKIIYTVHNILPHDSINYSDDSKYYELILSYTDLIIHHCQNSIELLAKVFPLVREKRNIVAPHGDYLVDFNEIEKVEAKKNLDIPPEKFVILNFGSQQPYKGGKFIESVFRSAKIPNKYLLTAGNYRFINQNIFGRNFSKILVKLKQKFRYSNKRYFYYSIPKDKISLFFSAADLVFLGHQDGLNSGVLNLAATFSKPVVFPDIGCFSQQMESWECETYKVGNTNDAVLSLQNSYKKIKNNEYEFNNTKWLNQNSWENHVETILKNIN